MDSNQQDVTGERIQKIEKCNCSHPKENTSRVINPPENVVRPVQNQAHQDQRGKYQEQKYFDEGHGQTLGITVGVKTNVSLGLQVLRTCGCDR